MKVFIRTLNFISWLARRNKTQIQASKQLGLSVSHFNRLVRAKSGTSPEIRHLILKKVLTGVRYDILFTHVFDDDEL